MKPDRQTASQGERKRGYILAAKSISEALKVVQGRRETLDLREHCARSHNKRQHRLLDCTTACISTHHTNEQHSYNR
eukprot:1844285-Rhodomonas_salina.2